MTSKTAVKIVNWKTAAARDAHGQTAYDLFRRQQGGFDSSFNYMTVFTLVPGGASGSHSHENWEKIYLMLSGEADAILDGKVYPMKEGDSVYIPAHMEHEMKNPYGALAVYANFTNYTMPLPPEADKPRQPRQ